jgi:hypothetical protein
VGDTGSIVAGAVAPSIVAARIPNGRLRWLPAATGAIAAFVINVVIL